MIEVLFYVTFLRISQIATLSLQYSYLLVTVEFCCNYGFNCFHVPSMMRPHYKILFNCNLSKLIGGYMASDSA
jgi:hypothetical protein